MIDFSSVEKTYEARPIHYKMHRPRLSHYHFSSTPEPQVPADQSSWLLWLGNLYFLISRSQWFHSAILSLRLPIHVSFHLFHPDIHIQNAYRWILLFLWKVHLCICSRNIGLDTLCFEMPSCEQPWLPHRHSPFADSRGGYDSRFPAVLFHWYSGVSALSHRSSRRSLSGRLPTARNRPSDSVLCFFRSSL